MTLSSLIELGICRKVHGIKGAFSLELFNPESRTLKKGDSLTVDKNGEQSLFKILNIQYGNKTILTLEGIDNRNQSEEMIPFSIYIERSKLGSLESDEFYLVDLVGAKVMNLEGHEIGVLKKFYESGAGTICTLLVDNEKVDIPLDSPFIKNIDIEENKMTVVLPEYI